MARRCRPGWTLALHLAAISAASSARGADPVAEARADYDAAAAAYDRNDYATAAARFARADERRPNPRALRLAMASALLVADAALAMNLVERSEARAQAAGETDPAVTELAHKLRVRFESGAGKVRIACVRATPCEATVDGDAIETSRARWVAPGAHVVGLRYDGPPVRRDVVVRAGETVDVLLEPLAAPVMPSREMDLREGSASRADDAAEGRRRHGLTPAFFWTGLAATGAAIGTAAVFTVLVAQRHDDFLQRPSVETADAGDAAQTRARVAWIVSGALTLTTVVLAVATDFRGSGGRPARAGARPGIVLGVGAGSVSLGASVW